MRLERIGTGLLVLATLVVAASILASGDVGRILNALGGVCWFVAAGMLVRTALGSTRQAMLWATVIGLTAVVAFVVRPSDLVFAAIGFGNAGFLMGMLARNRELLWVTLIPALYLPFHIGTAVLKAIVRSMMGNEATIRSEPPPTAAIVPFVMVIAALAGGYAAMTIKSGRSLAHERRLPSTDPSRRT